MYQMYFNQFPFENIKKSRYFEFDDLISKLIEIDCNKRIEWNDYYEHNFFMKCIINFIIISNNLKFFIL